MIFHPAVIGLLISSVLISAMILYASYWGYQILRQWDLKSGSEWQLALERRTYLISTILSNAFGLQILSLFLFLFTADDLHALFVGAMCAAGTLNVNAFGYVTLILKIVNFMLAGVWIFINAIDNRAYDYPLIKHKYMFLLIMMPFVLAEAATLIGYFFRLSPNIITSCCGSLFSEGAGSFSSSILSLPARPMGIAFYCSMAAAIISGLYSYIRDKGVYAFSAIAAIAFVAGVISLFSFIAPYVYELPTHHCPFCILQEEYGYIGYPFYAALLGGGLTGIVPGVIAPYKKVVSLNMVIPPVQKKLAVVSLACFFIVTAMASLAVITSSLVMSP